VKFIKLVTYCIIILCLQNTTLDSSDFLDALKSIKYNVQSAKYLIYVHDKKNSVPIEKLLDNKYFLFNLPFNYLNLHLYCLRIFSCSIEDLDNKNVYQNLLTLNQDWDIQIKKLENDEILKENDLFCKILELRKEILEFLKKFKERKETLNLNLDLMHLNTQSLKVQLKELESEKELKYNEKLINLIQNWQIMYNSVSYILKTECFPEEQKIYFEIIKKRSEIHRNKIYQQYIKIRPKNFFETLRPYKNKKKDESKKTIFT